MDNNREIILKVGINTWRKWHNDYIKSTGQVFNSIYEMNELYEPYNLELLSMYTDGRNIGSDLRSEFDSNAAYFTRSINDELVSLSVDEVVDYMAEFKDEVVVFIVEDTIY